MTTAQPDSSLNRLVIVVLVAVLGICGGLLLFWFNPAQHSFFPVCAFHQFTGLYCPGCGAQRAIHSLSHGQVLLALHFNPLLIVALPFLMFSGGRWLWRIGTGRPLPPIVIRPVYPKLIAATVIAFAILRNLPFPPFTYLAPP